MVAINNIWILVREVWEPSRKPLPEDWIEFALVVSLRVAWQGLEEELLLESGGGVDDCVPSLADTWGFDKEIFHGELQED